MNFEKSRKLSKKVIFWAIYKWLVYCVLMASDLCFHFLANGRSDRDLCEANFVKYTCVCPIIKFDNTNYSQHKHHFGPILGCFSLTFTQFLPALCFRSPHKIP